MPMFKPGKLILGFLISLTVAIIIHLLDKLLQLDLPGSLLLVLRWIPIIFYFLYAFKKNKLTTWIFVSMLAGVEFGHDVPLIAKELNIVSQIFIRLVKTIIAPLLFGTLVVGIAGHADLKQVGRMGWKSLVYFEVVSTIALFIGLIAINISKAGMGVQVPPEMLQGELPQVQAQSAHDIILHIFPENIARSIAEGQVLQIVVFSILFGIAVAMVSEKYRNPILKFRNHVGGDVQIHQHHHDVCPVCGLFRDSLQCGPHGAECARKPVPVAGNLYVSLLVFLLFVLLPIILF